MNAFSIGLLLLLSVPGALPRPPRPPPAATDAGASPGAAAQGLSDEELAARVDTYLDTIDTPVRAAQWQALGPRAVPLLEKVVRDPVALPSRRARAIGALSAIGGDTARQVVLDTARSDAQPYGVRASALRGAGRLLTPSELVKELGPIMEGAPRPSIRAVAADVLARHATASACPAIRAQAGRESSHARARFSRALELCGPAR